MHHSFYSPPALAVAPVTVPLLYALAASTLPRRRYTHYATLMCALAFLLAVASSLAWSFSNGDETWLTRVAPELPTVARLDAVTATVLPLIAFVALAITRFSSRYLHGDPGQRRYTRWLLATLASASALVMQNNLILFAAAWVLTSLTLHQLLIFYPERPLAVLAAHKKFIASRVADACVLGGFGLLAAQAGSFELHVVHAWSDAQASFTPAATLASVLLVVGAALKCAQLPFHGWLLQVMEAPTPVSALLHAGVVNMGGVLMMRMAPFMERMELAQTLLVAIGTTTAVAASLVMMTRVSVKVSLAWSTCAQMGFMLMQCGLGLYALALLHLLAHSLYKAHSFLSSGSVVAAYRSASLLPSHDAVPTARRMLATWLLALVGVVAIAALLQGGDGAALWVPCLTLALALGWLLVQASSPRATLQLALAGALLTVSYFSWHLLLAPAFGPASHSATFTLRVALASVGMLALSWLQLALLRAPHSKLARSVHARLFAGFYLDELFTRAVFALWPPKRLPRSTRLPDLHVPNTQES
ncbi:MAG TPA: NADH-quinone oxidoreductase subunit L [Polyangiales bacterium]